MEEFIKRYGLTLEARSVEASDSPFMNEGVEMMHFQCRLVMGDKKSAEGTSL